MRSTRRSLHATLLSLLLTLFATGHSVHADDDDADEYDETARVARISLITGEVTLKRNGNTDWEPARPVKYPDGDMIRTQGSTESNMLLRIVTCIDLRRSDEWFQRMSRDARREERRRNPRLGPRSPADPSGTRVAS